MPKTRRRRLSSLKDPEALADDVNLLLVDDANEMLNPGDHSANLWRILQFGHAADLIETQADQRFTLRALTTDRAAGLLDLDGFRGPFGFFSHCLNSNQYAD